MLSVDRIASILSALKNCSEGVGVIELSDRLKMPASSLHRTLRSLQSHGLIWQSPTTRKYMLGIGLVDLAFPLLSNMEPMLRERTRPLMAELAGRTQSTVYMAILKQEWIIAGDSIFPGHGSSPLISIYYGQTMPVHCAASAKAILAFLPAENQMRLISHCDFRTYTRATITNKTQLLKHLSDVRSHGFAVCAEEAEEGVTAIAMPALDSRGFAYASIGLCAPAQQLNEKQVHNVIDDLRKITLALSE